jgi:hypothetical protein
LRRERGERLHGRQLDVDAETVGVAAGAREQLVARLRDRLQMEVAAKVVLFAQHARDLDE